MNLGNGFRIPQRLKPDEWQAPMLELKIPPPD
jgi:hypothetical protein